MLLPSRVQRHTISLGPQARQTALNTLRPPRAVMRLGPFEARPGALNMVRETIDTPVNPQGVMLLILGPPVRLRICGIRR
jgi:hypothetical protein